MGRDAAFDYLANGPFCLVALDSATGRAVQINETFEQFMGPLYKFQGYKFASSASEEHQDKLSDAIQSLVDGKSEKATVRNVEMVTLAGEAGMPVRKHFDWTVGKGADNCILLFGEPCTGVDVEQRAKDAELIDFFQNAPIALHWLSGEGNVLWANQTELDVLGYTAEEYIGQPIMKFCPDEQELVLEIFQQLGSGNAIRDVPVRFRTKCGKIVNLLIDSNVKYAKDGSFGHTRCFIRDDTGRKIREARAKLLLEETKRSLKMLDNFMSRSMHHMKTALQVLSDTCDVVSTNLYKRINEGTASIDDMENVTVVQDSSEHIDDVLEMIEDIIDLARFDQGMFYEPRPEKVELKSLGLEVIAKTDKVAKNVDVAVQLGGGGPAVVNCDSNALKRILRRLFQNAVEATTAGSITLDIRYNAGRCMFTLIDSGPGVRQEDIESSDGNLPRIFQRYHKEIVPDETLDFEKALNLRQKIEEGLSSHRKNGLGIGLAVSYHLVLALGGDLRYSSRPGMTKFWFSLPLQASSHMAGYDLETGRIMLDTNKGTNNLVQREAPPFSSPTFGAEDEMMSQVTDHNSEMSSLVPKESVEAEEDQKFFVMIVEDTKAVAKLLCMMLSRLDCLSSHAESGQEAVDLLTYMDPEDCDLILMNLRMREMDGFEAMRIIKHEMKLDIPVIALTGETGAEVRKQCEDAGFDGFITKPFKKEQLKDLINRRRLDTACIDTISSTRDSDMEFFEPREKFVGTDYPSLIEAKVDLKRKSSDKNYDEFNTIPVPKKKIAGEGLKAMDRLSVLLVEDTDAAAKLFRRMLTKLDCSSARAENGKEAIDILRDAMPGMYDLILMDLRMPVMDGFQATQIIKNELKLDIPVIALTGETSLDVRKQCEEIGFDGFYSKPLTREVLKEIVENPRLHRCILEPETQ